MKNTIITVGSVTYAIKLQKLLARSKISSSIVKIARGENEGGCTNGLEIYDSDFFSAVAIMRENRIAYKIYSGYNDIS